MNIKRSPVEDAAIPFRRESQDLHFGIEAEQGVAKGRALIRSIQCDDQQIRVGPLNNMGNFIFVMNFRDDFNVGLVDDRLEHQLSHQPGSICDDNTNRLSHLFRSAFRSAKLERTLLEVSAKRKGSKRVENGLLGKRRLGTTRSTINKSYNLLCEYRFSTISHMLGAIAEDPVPLT